MDRTGPQRARDEELRQFGKQQAYLLIAQEDQAKAGNQPGLPPQPKPLPLFHHQGRGQVPFKAMPGPIPPLPLDSRGESDSIL